MTITYAAPTEDELAAAVHAAGGATLVRRSVALVGFMGAGKTSVGRQLGRLLGRPFLDTDHLVEQASGTTIPALFATSEAVFRRLEREAVAAVLDGPPCVIALGGGALETDGVLEDLLARAFVVHVHVPWRLLRAQLPELARGRPVIAGRSVPEIHDLYLRRSARYRRAHLRVSVPRTNPHDAAVLIAMVLGALGADVAPRGADGA
jgi:shikimate kinase